MQVAGQPRRRPYGLVLICLVVLCLTVPRYWHVRSVARSRPHGTSQTNRALDASSASALRPALLDEALFADLVSSPRRAAITSPQPLWADAWTAASRSAASWLQRGKRLAQLSPADLKTLVERLAETGSQPKQKVVAAPTLRLTSPRDRLAMAPRINRRLPRLSELPDVPLPPPIEYQDADWPWTRPAGLFAQLGLLRERHETAAWAQNTIAQLNLLTGREAVDSANAPVLLQRLDQLADEAIRLAAGLEDDRLRVEVLRAHWGLVRRLDCWSKMCEISAASPARQRLAARGSIDGLLEGPPGINPESVDIRLLGANLEAYEESGAPSLGRDVRAQQMQLSVSDKTAERDLGEAIDTHYRNANIRIALTAELLSRYLSAERVVNEPVCDCIVGTPVRGQSEITSQSKVHLEPATGLWHLELETNGVVQSNTLADGGPAVLHSRSATDFRINKPILIDSEGIRMRSSTGDADNYAQLCGVKTNFDWIPVLGAYVRARAIEEYHAKRPRAKAEVECKVAARATRRVEDEAGDAVDRVEQEVQERFTGRLREHGIEVTPIEMTTTSERLIARLRLASDGELGAHSPRPRAPADSLGSLQIHQSAMTNAAIALELNGKRLTAPELQQSLRTTFPRLAEEREPRDVREDTVFHFVDADAIQFRFADGRAELMITLREFVYEGRATRNFIVHAFYRPQVDGLDAKLVRDGPLGIEGRLSAGDRARLHNVFETVLPEDRTIPVFSVDDPDDPRLAGLMITQLVLEDGWAGIAIGPTSDGRVAQHWRSLR